MSHPEPRIQCSNHQCGASNKLEALVCHRCNTPTIRRYLWSNKKVISNDQEQTLINGRYLALSTQIFLDTQPSKPPVTPEEVPQDIVAYLQLFPCYPHVPQVYGLLDGTDAWLLDYGTVPSNVSGKLDYPEQLIPELRYLWPSATALQQLNWLWQIAKLWKPLSSKKVASTLLNPDLIRINGQVVQILQLQSDEDNQLSLRELGDLWSQWVEDANPSIQDMLEQLSARLETGIIEKVTQAIAVLDRAANQCRKAQQYSYRIYALSDSGPSRNNNEDAAYPVYNQSNYIPASENSLAIVCDGVGGHDGGEIASQETIRYLRSKISKLALEEHSHSPEKVLVKLTKYINGTNDIISQRNDTEQRQERQRMGTTLVMTLSCAHEMYIAHVGDSRIYWITSNSCHQVTIDDDLASREVRLGYAVYRDSLQYPSAGALIQALGMRDSAALHPNLQRYIVDDDCIFLLCTDGLSDFDRVEQNWRHKVLPVLEGKQDLVSAVKDLIGIANNKNGHDNVTVALVHCQVTSQADASKMVVSWSDVEFAMRESSLWSDTNLTNSIVTDSNSVETPPAETAIPEEQIGEPLSIKSQPKWLKPLILFLIVSLVSGLIALFLVEKYFQKPDNSNPAVDSHSNPAVDLKNQK
ncbi:MAG: serine/threonine-protein phosphatase [Pleurocapsa sp. MO_192.B19]|nr:serine/threonine-protein phosphatase [Pleurocapsa sp. MO_192.B19]